VQATLRGIKYTVTYPEDAYEDSEDYVEGLPAMDEHLRIAEIERYAGFYQVEPYGYTDPASWENMQSLLIKMGLLSAELDLSAAFTNEFIE
jgi:hypothetical protein